MGMSVMAVLMLTGSLALNDMVLAQTSNVLSWNFVRLPVAAVLFIVSAFAECNRAPFDLPEGESELVAGYHVEYSSMKFGMFFMGEYANMIIASALIATLFFGGWQVPFVSTEFLRSHAGGLANGLAIGFSAVSLILGFILVASYKRQAFGDNRDREVLILGIPAILTGLALAVFLVLNQGIELSVQAGLWFVAAFQAVNFLGKILFFCWFFIWVRWTLPRFRYDQLMRLGWKYMLPLATAQVFWVAVKMLF
jgi:NADH-quinone oxidoreductase subunit H